MRHLQIFVFLLVLGSVSQISESWSWFSSSTDNKYITDEQTRLSNDLSLHPTNPDLSIEVFYDSKGLELFEDMNNNLVAPNLCWQNAYRHLYSTCKNIAVDQEKQDRLVWYLSDCFLRDSGKDPYPFCDDKAPMINCRKKLTKDEDMIYLKFSTKIHTLCHQLEHHELKYEVARLGSSLLKSAYNTEDTLDNLNKKSDKLVDSSNLIYNSMESIDTQVQTVVKTTQTLEEDMTGVKRQAMEIYTQGKAIRVSQSELRDRQVELNNAVKEGIEMINENYENITQDIDNLKNETHKIDSEINKLGDSMVSKMSDLQSKADDIGAVAGSSLDMQQKLLDNQSVALKGIQSLTRFQLEVLEESRNTLQRFAEYDRQQQEENLKKQEELKQVHDLLFKNSKTMLEVQDAFEGKQADMFVVLDKFYALHDAILVESWPIKAFVCYSITIFIIYMFTSTKQTYILRPTLYTELCVTLSVEVAIHRFTNDIQKETWMTYAVWLIFVGVAIGQLCYAVYTYSDFEQLNHQILVRLVDTIGEIQSREELDEDIYNDDIDWNLWVDTDVQDDVGMLEDPDQETSERIIETTSSTMSSDIKRRYGLRKR